MYLLRLVSAMSMPSLSLLQVFEKLVQLRGCPRLLGWTWRVVQNTHRMSARQSKFAPSVTVEFSENSFSTVETQQIGPFEQLAGRELQEALSQTAKSLRISKEAVRTRLVRAQRALRSSLDSAQNGSAGRGSSLLAEPDLDVVVHEAAAAHGLEILAVHHLGQEVGDPGAPSPLRYAIYELIDPSPARGLNGADTAFPVVIYRIDLLRSSSGWKIYATCGPAKAAVLGSGQFSDLLHGVENAFTLLFGEGGS